MATTGEARAVLDAANVLIAEAMTHAQTAAGKFAEASTMLAALRGDTSAALGDRAADVAREQCEQAFVRGHAAIETNESYGATL